MKEKLYELLSKLKIGKNKGELHNFADKYKVYILEVKEKYYRQVLYVFFNILGIQIHDYETENHYNMELVDIWMEQKSNQISANYGLWHILQSNQYVRKPQASSYDDFKEILKGDKELYDCLINLENTIPKSDWNCDIK